MKYILALLLTVITSFSFGQVYTIKTIVKNDSAYQFPVIQSSQRPELAKKFNTIIQSNLGGHPEAENPFDSIQNEDEYSFESGAVNDRVLALIVTGAHSGCGYHETRTVYNFDSKTGVNIDLDMLFGSDGMPRLKKALAKAWKEKLKANLNTPSPEDDYRRCLNESQNLTELDPFTTLIQDQGISFWAGSCLDGSNYASDASKGPHEFSLGQLLPMLTSYGYGLFVTKKSPDPVQTLLRGTIDKYPISLTLLPGKTPNTVGGMIVYHSVGQPITLSGTIAGNKITLHEVDASNHPVSNIDAMWDGKKLTGMFVNLKANKPMTFTVNSVAPVGKE